jgi:hypothetical protein
MGHRDRITRTENGKLFVDIPPDLFEDRRTSNAGLGIYFISSGSVPKCKLTDRQFIDGKFRIHLFEHLHKYCLKKVKD